MRIVPQLAPPAHSRCLLLAAPPIAGLLPARVPSSLPEPILLKPLAGPKFPSKRDQMHALWAAQDAELEDFLEGARQRLTAKFDEIARRREANQRAWEWLK